MTEGNRPDARKGKPEICATSSSHKTVKTTTKHNNKTTTKSTQGSVASPNSTSMSESDVAGSDSSGLDTASDFGSLSSGELDMTEAERRKYEEYEKQYYRDREEEDRIMDSYYSADNSNRGKYDYGSSWADDEDRNSPLLAKLNFRPGQRTVLPNGRAVVPKLSPDDCLHYYVGICTKKEKCKFRHKNRLMDDKNHDECIKIVRQIPGICRDYAMGGCFRSHCMFKHDRQYYKESKISVESRKKSDRSTRDHKGLVESQLLEESYRDAPLPPDHPDDPNAPDDSNPKGDGGRPLTGPKGPTVESYTQGLPSLHTLHWRSGPLSHIPNTGATANETCLFHALRSTIHFLGFSIVSKLTFKIMSIVWRIPNVVLIPLHNSLPSTGLRGVFKAFLYQFINLPSRTHSALFLWLALVMCNNLFWGLIGWCGLSLNKYHSLRCVSVVPNPPADKRPTFLKGGNLLYTGARAVYEYTEIGGFKNTFRPLFAMSPYTAWINDTWPMRLEKETFVACPELAAQVVHTSNVSVLVDHNTAVARINRAISTMSCVGFDRHLYHEGQSVQQGSMKLAIAYHNHLISHKKRSNELLKNHQAPDALPSSPTAIESEKSPSPPKGNLTIPLLFVVTMITTGLAVRHLRSVWGRSLQSQLVSPKSKPYVPFTLLKGYIRRRFYNLLAANAELEEFVWQTYISYRNGVTL